MSLWEEKKIVREAYILRSDHRRLDGNRLGFNKPQGSLVSGRTQASLQELAD